MNANENVISLTDDDNESEAPNNLADDGECVNSANNIRIYNNVSSDSTTKSVMVVQKDSVLSK